MPIVKAKDIGYVRFTAPDLNVMEAFLSDFGLVRAERRDGTLYMKGLDGAPFVHVTEKGEPGFAGFAFELPEMATLETLAAATGKAVQTLQAPGGGHFITLTDPDGFRIDAVARDYGPFGKLRPSAPINRGAEKIRYNAVSRIALSPAEIVRLGHCVLNVSDFRTSEAWYKHHFGLITSDEIETGPDAVLGAFLRCDQGDKPVDHHTLFLIGSGSPGFNHAAFEVDDFNSLMAGHDHLMRKAYSPHWGVGRHILGSQIFDYWKDPWGHVLEHWTDGDLFDAKSGSNAATFEDLLGTQWGPASPRFANDK